MTSLRRFLAVLAIGLGFSAPALAITDSPDFTDLWFVPAESGWGLNLIQQGNTLFGTLFVYGPDNSPRWYVASDLKPVATSAGTYVFSGNLFSTTGTFFGTSPFTFGATTLVGALTVTFPTSNTGTLQYTVNGVTVSKAVQRQTFVVNSLQGTYYGGMIALTSSCVNSANNAQFANFTGDLVGTFSGTTATFRLDYAILQNGIAFPATCNFAGPYTQAGRYGAVSGQWSCVYQSTILNNGTFTLTEIDTQKNGLTAQVRAVDQFCTYDGHFGGIRNVGTQ